MRLLDLLLAEPPGGKRKNRRPRVMDDLPADKLSAFDTVLGNSLLTECMPQLSNFFTGSYITDDEPPYTLGLAAAAHRRSSLSSSSSSPSSSSSSASSPPASSSALATLLQSTRPLSGGGGATNSTHAVSRALTSPSPPTTTPTTTLVQLLLTDSVITASSYSYPQPGGATAAAVAAPRQPTHSLQPDGETDGGRPGAVAADDARGDRLGGARLRTVSADDVYGDRLEAGRLGDVFGDLPGAVFADDAFGDQLVQSELTSLSLHGGADIDITKFPLFNLDHTLFENGIDATDMTSLLEKFEASTGSLSTMSSDRVPHAGSVASSDCSEGSSAVSTSSRTPSPVESRADPTAALFPMPPIRVAPEWGGTFKSANATRHKKGKRDLKKSQDATTVSREAVSASGRNNAVKTQLNAGKDGRLVSERPKVAVKRRASSPASVRTAKRRSAEICQRAAQQSALRSAAQQSALGGGAQACGLDGRAQPGALRGGAQPGALRGGAQPGALRGGAQPGGLHGGAQPGGLRGAVAVRSAAQPRGLKTESEVLKLLMCRQSAPRTTMSAPCSPAPTPPPSPKSKRKSAQRTAIMLPIGHAPGRRPGGRRAGHRKALPTVSDSEAALSDTAVMDGPPGAEEGEGEEGGPRRSKISISLYRSRLEERRQRQPRQPVAPPLVGVSRAYYALITDHDYCSNVPLSGASLHSLLTAPVGGDIPTPLRDLPASLPPIPLPPPAAVAAAAAAAGGVGPPARREATRAVPPTPVPSAVVMPTAGVGGATAAGRPAVVPRRCRRNTSTEVIDMDIDDDAAAASGGASTCHGVTLSGGATAGSVTARKSDDADVIAATNVTVTRDGAGGTSSGGAGASSGGAGASSSGGAPTVVAKTDNVVVVAVEKTSVATAADGASCDAGGSTGGAPSGKSVRGGGQGRPRGQSGRARGGRQYRGRESTPPDPEYYDKLPTYCTVPSATSVYTHPERGVAAAAVLVPPPALPTIDRDPSPDRRDPTYDKLPAYHRCFTNSTRYDSLPTTPVPPPPADPDSASDRSCSDSDCSCSESASSATSLSSPPTRGQHRAARGRSARRCASRRRCSYSSSSRSRSRSSRSRSRLSRSSSRSHRRSRFSRHRSTRSRSFSRSRSRSRCRSRHRRHSSCRSHRSRSLSQEKWFAEQEKKREQETKKQIDERKIIYVGRIPRSFTKATLRRKFECFGQIEVTSVHFREHGDNYGFVTFTYTCDAFAAIEKGQTVPGCENFDLCFGGRRRFCKSVYSDLDGNMEMAVEHGMMRVSKPAAAIDFDTLLRQATSSLRR